MGRIPMVNIYASRRGAYEKCAWLKRDEEKSLDPEWAKKPTGVFYATEENPEYGSDSRVLGTFMADTSTITLKTSDDVEGIMSDDLVRYDDRDWVVTGVSLKKVKQRSEFCRKSQYVTYMTLRGL